MQILKQNYNWMNMKGDFLPNKQSRHRVTEVDSPPLVKKHKRTNVTAGTKNIKEHKSLEEVNFVNPLRDLAHLQTQPLQIVFLTSQVKKCLGCTKYFTLAERKEPVDFIFMEFMQRPRPYNNNQWGRAEGKAELIFIYVT